MSENEHKPDNDPLEARLQTLRLTGFPSPLLERLLVVQPPPVRYWSLSKRMFFAGALAALLSATTLILIHSGRLLRVATLPPVVTREPILLSPALTIHRITAPRAARTPGVLGPMPRESLAAYQRIAAQGNEAMMAMLSRDAATASPSLAVSKSLSPRDYRLFEND